jgi:hypothetical protein
VVASSADSRPTDDGRAAERYGPLTASPLSTVSLEPRAGQRAVTRLVGKLDTN